MSDEITDAPAVTEDNTAIEPIPGSVVIDPSEGMLPWPELSIDQKIDILAMKIDAVGNQTTWIGSTLQGIIDMVGKVSPMDVFKMLRGGK